MRDSKTTRFTKAVRVTPEHYGYICLTKKKKSQAGRLEQIIQRHIDKNAAGKKQHYDNRRRPAKLH